MPGDQYRFLAADYHWFFDDVALFLGCDTPGVRLAMAGLAPGARVLDAACGIGVDAAALVRRGFDVTAADASEAMAAEAGRRLARLESDRARVITSTWAELPANVGAQTFDAVFCVGNSISHAPDAGSMIDAFEAFSAVLAPGGTLVVDTYDWEMVHADGSRLMIEPSIVERDGARCVRTYSWHLPDEFGEPCVLEIAPIFLDGDQATMRSHTVTMWPFTRAQLRQRLAATGLVSIALDVIPGEDRYTAIARRPPRG